MNEKTLTILIGLIILLVGYYCVYKHTNGYVLFGLFMAQWGNNVIVRVTNR